MSSCAAILLIRSRSATSRVMIRQCFRGCRLRFATEMVPRRPAPVPIVTFNRQGRRRPGRSGIGEPGQLLLEGHREAIPQAGQGPGLVDLLLGFGTHHRLEGLRRGTEFVLLFLGAGHGLDHSPGRVGRHLIGLIHDRSAGRLAPLRAQRFEQLQIGQQSRQLAHAGVAGTLEPGECPCARTSRRAFACRSARSPG